MEPGSSENAIMQAWWVGNYTVIFIVVAKKKMFWNNLMHPKVYIVYLLLTLFLLSSFWSINSFVTFRRSSALLLSYVAMTGVLSSLSEESMIKSFRIFFSIIILSTFFIFIISPDSVLTNRHQHFGAWAGPFSHHNTFGRIAALSAIFWFMHRKSFSRMHYSTMMTILSLIGLYLSNSEGAWIFFIAAVVILLFIHLYQKGKNIFVLYFYSLLVLSIIIILQVELFLDVFNKSSDLTGRIFLWQKALSDLAHQPFLGFGYGVYWDYNTSSLNSLTPEIELLWDAPHSHNGYIEVALAGGIVGLLLYLFVLLAVIRDAFTLIKSPKLSTQLIFVIILMFFIISTGLFINTPFVRNDFNFFIFLYAFMTIRFAVAEKKAGLKGHTK
jgi:exopolysaccharide production protein ExoQ